MRTKRVVLLASLLACLLAGPLQVAAQDPAPAQPAAQPTAAPAQPAQPPNVSVNVTRTEETWYMNPMLIGLGVLVLVVLVVLASRGGEPSTTTIVKD
jgi:hypothetical protein